MTVSAIVLRVRPYRESDSLVDLLTREQGIMTAIARGARKSLRRFGGRHPLCAIGVTSLIAVILRPKAAKARNALSRPVPGPWTSTSSVLMPCSCAFFPASSAAIWAA